MRKKISLPELSYRKKLLHLAKFYKIAEIKKNLFKRRLTNKQIELLLKKNSITLPKEINKNLGFYSWNIFYKSIAVSIILITIFGLLPIISKNNLKNNSHNIVKNNERFLKNKEAKKLLNKNKQNSIQQENEPVINEKKSNDVLDNTIRLSAATLEEIFESSGYDLKDIRRTKKVKPIYISILPAELSEIESSKKRKSIFIKIVLPLILTENKKIMSDRKKLFRILGKTYNDPTEKKWLKNKFKEYNIKNSDLSELKIRMDIIPASLALAQAAKETGWGTSRFAQEGNALFGQWTYSEDGLEPIDNVTGNHKVMRFNVLQASVTAYKKNLNTHKVYNKFRLARAELREKNKKIDSLVLVKYLDKYAETGDKYILVLEKIIRQNMLEDFDNAKLLPTKLIVNQNI